jgi:helix-turn-helix protein
MEEKQNNKNRKQKLVLIVKHTVQNKFQSYLFYRTKKENKQTIEQYIEYTINLYK